MGVQPMVAVCAVADSSHVLSSVLHCQVGGAHIADLVAGQYYLRVIQGLSIDQEELKREWSQAMSEALKNYLELDKKLLEIGERKTKLLVELEREKDQLQDLMDEAWKKLSDEEQRRLSNGSCEQPFDDTKTSSLRQSRKCPECGNGRFWVWNDSDGKETRAECTECRYRINPSVEVQP